MLKVFFILAFLPTKCLFLCLFGGPVSPIDLLLVFVNQLYIYHVVLLAFRVLGVDKAIGSGLDLGGLRLLLSPTAKVKHLYELIKIQYYYINGH